MDSTDWIMVLLAIQTSLIAMIFFQSGMFGRGLRQYEETLASRVAALIGNIMRQPHTETATMNLMIKALESQKTQEAASAFIRKLVMQLLEESLHLSESFHKHGEQRLMEAQRGSIPPADGDTPEDGSSSGTAAAASEFRRRPVPTTPKAETGTILAPQSADAQGTDGGVIKCPAALHTSSSSVLQARPRNNHHHHHHHQQQQQQAVSLVGTGADGPSPKEMRSLLTSGMERTRRIVEHEMLSSETVDLIVTMIAKVVEDKRLEDVVAQMLSEVLAKDEVTEALSKSITGVGSSFAGRFLPNALLKATGHPGKSTRPPS